MFGEFIIRSTQQFMESLSPSTVASVAETTTNVASDGAAYSSNFTFQLMMLGITFLYLLIRNYDFKQLPYSLELVHYLLGSIYICFSGTVWRLGYNSHW